MRYCEIVNVYFELEKTTKRLEKTKIIADFLKNIDEKEIEDVVYLLLGRVFPGSDERKIGFSSRLMMKAIASASGASFENVEKLMTRAGDLGKVAEGLMGKKTQATLVSKSLTIELVLGNIRKLASLEGEGTVNRKIGLVVDLLMNANEKESRYIVNTVLENLRIGISDGVIRDSIAQAYNVQIKEVENASDLAGDYAEIALLAKAGKLGKVGLKVGRAVKCELAVIAENVEEGFEALGKPAMFEVKLDGFRLQCHYGNGKYWLYTRRMELVNNQFPDIIEIMKKHVNKKNYILDCEAVGYDKDTGKYLSFQSISQRIKRKYDVEEIASKFPVELNVFDVLLVDDENVMHKKLSERRKILEKMIDEKKGKIVLTRKLITDDNEKAFDFFNKAIKEGYEGVMIKNLDSEYKAGRYVNGWMKLKKILEPLDLVVVKAEYGEGKRAGWLTSFTLSCNLNGNLLEIGKVSTGVKEKNEGLTYKEMTKMLKPLIINQEGKEVEVKAKIILEVGYEEIQKSQSYSSGYALRFPRVIRLREDKGLKEISNLKLVEEIYRMQRGKR